MVKQCMARDIHFQDVYNLTKNGANADQVNEREKPPGNNVNVSSETTSPLAPVSRGHVWNY